MKSRIVNIGDYQFLITGSRSFVCNCYDFILWVRETGELEWNVLYRYEGIKSYAPSINIKEIFDSLTIKII